MHMLPQGSLIMWISLRPLKSTLLQMYLKSLCWDGGCSAVITCITEDSQKIMNWLGYKVWGKRYCLCMKTALQCPITQSSVSSFFSVKYFAHCIKVTKLESLDKTIHIYSIISYYTTFFLSLHSVFLVVWITAVNATFNLLPHSLLAIQVMNSVWPKKVLFCAFRPEKDLWNFFCLFQEQMLYTCLPAR